MRHTSIGIRSKEDCGRQEMFDIRCGKGHIEYYIQISNFKQQYTHVLLLWYLNDYEIGLTIDICSATLFHRMEYHDIRAAVRFKKFQREYVEWYRDRIVIIIVED